MQCILSEAGINLLYVCQLHQNVYNRQSVCLSEERLYVALSKVSCQQVLRQDLDEEGGGVWEQEQDVY